jgi:hypothetical protein
MLRSLLAIFAGLVLGVTVVWLVELPAMLMYPLPPGIDPSDKDAMQKYVATLPTLVVAWGVIAWTAGSLAGAWLAARIAGRGLLLHGLVIGLCFLAMDVAMILFIPHPLWLAVLGFIAPLASALLGAWLAARMAGPPDSPRPYDLREKNMAC